MKLVYSPTSPFARKVRVFAIESGLDSQLELVTANPFADDGAVAQRNPLGKVPALLVDDAVALVDSPVICEYLDSLHGEPKLFPEGRARWDALRLQALGDGVMDATLLRRLETLRPDELQSDAWMQRQVDAIRRTLDVLEVEASELPAALTIGHVTLGCALGYLDFRLAEEDWRASRPALRDWFGDFAERPSMKATQPPT